MTATPPPAPRLAALRYRDFRLLWFGLLVSITGSQMQLTAVNWHIYQLLRGESYHFSILGLQLNLGAEALGLGALGLVRVLPIIIFGMIGGMPDVVGQCRWHLAELACGGGEAAGALDRIHHGQRFRSQHEVTVGHVEAFEISELHLI